jgi:excisionase family DNA binding protein
MLLTVREAAGLLKSSERQVYRWVDEDEIPFQRVCDQVTDNGFRVDSATTFLEEVPFLGPGHTDLFLFYLPQKEWVRNAILTEARRANPTLPIEAMAAQLSDDVFQLLARFHVSSVLPARGNWRGALEALRKALTTIEPEIQKQP